MSKKRNLVLFDFDGTLTKGDSLPRFLLFSVPTGRLFAGLAVLAFKYLKLLFSFKWSNSRAKELLLGQFFTGIDEQVIRGAGTSWLHQTGERFFRKQLMETMRCYRDQGDEVVVVSASLDIWLQPFCARERVEMICTEAAFAAGKCTGRFATPNCKGREKARRIRERYQFPDFANIIAYGNSEGDFDMLELADEAWLVRHGEAVAIH